MECIFTLWKYKKYKVHRKVLEKPLSSQKLGTNTYFQFKKNLVWHSHNFFLPYIIVEEYFINSITFIFNLYFLCFVVDELPAFKLLFMIWCLVWARSLRDNAMKSKASECFVNLDFLARETLSNSKRVGCVMFMIKLWAKIFKM